MTATSVTSCSGLVYNAVYNKSVNKYNKINDSTDDKYVIVVNNEVKIVEKLGKNSYKDIITGDIYNTSEVLEVKGTLNKILSFEEIMEIENNTYFDDADWTKVYENIRNKYQASWCNDIKYKDRHLEIDEFSSDELSEFFYEVGLDPTFTILDDKNTKLLVNRAIDRLFEDLYEEKVERVNTHITPRGVKVAYIKLVEEEMAEELAVRMGVF